MNNRQRIVLWFVAALAVAMFLYPPVCMVLHNQYVTIVRPEGYKLTWKVDVPQSVDSSRLMLQYAVLAILGFVAHRLLRSDNEASPSRP